MNENEQLALEIQGRIKQLEELSGAEIKTEMDEGCSPEKSCSLPASAPGRYWYDGGLH